MVNFSMNQQFNGMSTHELEEYIEGAKAELARRKNERAEKLIEKVCVELNELKSLGVNFFIVDSDGDEHFIFDQEDPIARQNFVIPEVK